MNRCKEVRERLDAARRIIYKRILHSMDEISAETVSVELGRGSVALEEVEDDLTRLSAAGQDVTDLFKEARQLWIAATQVPADAGQPKAPPDESQATQG